MTDPVSPPAAPTPPPGPAVSPEQDVQENKDIAALSYLWIMSVVVYALKRDSPFVRYHSKQAMLLFVLTIPVWFIPLDLLARLLELLILAGMVVGFLGAAQGKRKSVPFVGPLSRGEMTLRQAWRELLSLANRGSGAVVKLFRKLLKPKRAQDDDTPPNPDGPSASAPPPTP